LFFVFKPQKNSLVLCLTGILVHVPGVAHKGFTFDLDIGSCSWSRSQRIYVWPGYWFMFRSRSQRIYVWPVYWFMPGVDHMKLTRILQYNRTQIHWQEVDQGIAVQPDTNPLTRSWPGYCSSTGHKSIDMKLTRVLQFNRTQIHWQEVDQGIAVQPDTNPLTRSWPGYCSTTGHKSIDMKLTRVLQFKCV